MIELAQLSKIYTTHQQTISALKDINLQIAPGEIFGILGRSGAGKSTLLRTINLLERPSSGSVKINGVELTRLTSAELSRERQSISVIFQHFNLLSSRTVSENIALPLEILHTAKRHLHQKVNELIEWIGLTSHKNYYPAQLSGGQKQRVAIARALAVSPKILLSDEATSALDPESTHDILQLLKKSQQDFGVTIVLITHELAVVKKICDRIGVMDKGTFIEQDHTVNLLAQPKTLLTKKFIQQGFHLSAISTIPKKNTLLVQLTFVGETSEAPIIFTLIKNYTLTVNIRQAQIEEVQNTVLGFTICELTGPADTLQAALNYLQSASVQVEVLSHG